MSTHKTAPKGTYIVTKVAAKQGVKNAPLKRPSLSKIRRIVGDCLNLDQSRIAVDFEDGNGQEFYILGYVHIVARLGRNKLRVVAAEHSESAGLKGTLFESKGKLLLEVD